MDFKLSKELRNRIERIYLFANSDFYVRYYGSRLGILWAFINPFFQILVYYLSFTYFIFRNSDPTFMLYLFTGIITWGFFSETTNQAINLFQKQRYILQNIDIPKIDFFWSLIGSKFWGYMVNFMIFFIFDLIFYKPEFSINLLFLIPIWIGLILFTIGISFFLATLYIYLRDLDHLWSITLMAGFWLVPIIWDYKILYDKAPFMFYLPITAFMTNIRQVVLQNQVPDLKFMISGIVVSSLIAICGYYFMKFNSKKALEFL